jgi:hypothetical protein
MLQPQKVQALKELQLMPLLVVQVLTPQLDLVLVLVKEDEESDQPISIKFLIP